MTRMTEELEDAKVRSQQWNTDTERTIKSINGVEYDANMLSPEEEDQLFTQGFLDKELDDVLNQIGLETLRGGF